MLKRQRLASDMAELTTLRLRVQQAERDAVTNKSAGDIMHQMINAGIAKQTSGDTIAINTAEGVQTYKVAAPETEVKPQNPSRLKNLVCLHSYFRSKNRQNRLRFCRKLQFACLKHSNSQ